MYCTWKVQDLKNELKKRGGRLTGKKADLIDRLEAYDRNFNFGNQSPESLAFASECQAIDLPAAETYLDVNSSTVLPKLTKKQHIQTYFDRFNKNISDAVRLYESRYLLVLRSTTSCDDTYLKGYCKASMKQLQYEINIKLGKDGMPEEASCECAAGEGKEAHCKHIAVVLLAAENIVREKIILLHEVSTSQLQTFHKPSKKYYATPLRASRLPSKRDYNSVYSPYLRHNPNFDINAYRCRFQSLILNYPQSSMPLKQLYPVANQRAICLDHDYLEKPAVDIFLESIYLLNVSKDNINQIELETRGQNNNLKWHEHRKMRITASIFHTVCHLKSERLNIYSNQILNKSTVRTRAMAHGIINEKVAIKRYMEAYDLNVKDCGLFVSHERPYLGASPDGLLGEETIIEVKCPYSCRYNKISPISVPFLQENENGHLTLKKNNLYYYQVQGQLYVTERLYCNLIVYTFNDLKIIYIERDDNFIEEMLIKLDYFYYNHFKEAVIKKYFFKE